MSQAMRRFGSKVTMIDRNGLDEKAIEAVHRWRFRATLNGQPVATQIAVQLDFRLD